uniref:Transcription factor TFIIB cyclin-like domain-containing protein n=1 Tax=Leersia perrieri TaxID=77586 RepID=A0A0D9WZ83_9ORYZ
MMYGCPDGVRYCHRYQRVTPMVLDHTTGDAICIECAFVPGKLYSDPSRRAASGDDSDDGGSVGGGLASPADPLLPDCEVVAKLQADDAAPRMRKMRGSVNPDMNKALVEGFEAIDDMATRLGLPDTIIDRGKGLLRKLEEAKACRIAKGRSRDALYAACLHTACRMEGSPRTLKELISATSDAATTKRDMGKFINASKRHLGKEVEEAGQEQDQAEDMKRIGGGGGDVVVLRMNAPRRAAGILQEGESIDVRRNPQFIAAAIVYMALQLSGDGRGKDFLEVSAATSSWVGMAAVMNSFRSLRCKAMLHVVCTEGPERVKEFIAMGASFDHGEDGRLHFAREVDNDDSITLFDHHFAIDLLTSQLWFGKGSQGIELSQHCTF